MEYNKNKKPNFGSNPDATIIDYSNKDPLDLNINSFLNDANDEGDKTIHGISTSNDLLIIQESNQNEKYSRLFNDGKYQSQIKNDNTIRLCWSP